MNMTSAEARAIAKEAYIYGFPMVDNLRVQYAYFTDKKDPDYKAPYNTLFNIPRVFTPDDKAIQTPNSDTPYSWIGLDLRAEPARRQSDQSLRSRDAGGARRHGTVDRAEGASRHDAFTGPQGDTDPDGTGNGTVGLSDERVSSPPDGLGGWPLKTHQPDRQASARSMPRQGCAGAGVRPPLTRPAARRQKVSSPLRTRRDTPDA